MVLENLPLYAAITGTALAGLIDLKTTEIPDEIPVAMVAFAVIWGVWRFAATGSTVLLNSLLVGGVFFGLGFIMYYTGQWGGGDAKLMAGVGALVPQAPALAAATLFPFPVSYLLNVLMLGAVYIIGYAFVVSIPDRRVTSAFLKDVHGGWRELAAFAALLGAVAAGTMYISIGSLSTEQMMLAFSLVPGGVGLFLLWRFLKVVEDVGFHWEIGTDELRVGDMLGEDVEELEMEKKLIRGLEEDEIEAIREHRDTITIRGGVRFGPVFLLALLYTIQYGDTVLAFSLFA